MERLGNVLERLGDVLRRQGGVCWRCLEASWDRLGVSKTIKNESWKGYTEWNATSMISECVAVNTHQNREFNSKTNKNRDMGLDSCLIGFR